jgi:chromosome condensin MukBEF ATPase and DNA-binding subunit MukB
MTNLEREMGNLEARMETVETELQGIRRDVREIRDALVRAKGGWMVLLFVFSAATTLGAIMGRFSHFLMGQQP